MMMMGKKKPSALPSDEDRKVALGYGPMWQQLLLHKQLLSQLQQ